MIEGLDGKPLPEDVAELLLWEDTGQLVCWPDGTGMLVWKRGRQEVAADSPIMLAARANWKKYVSA